MRKTAVLAVLAVCPCSLAWGPVGHRLVARIADTQLTPAARAKIAAILAPGETIVSMASWADDTRRVRTETGPWHYIDIPITEKHLDMARDCPKGDCVITKIADFRKELADSATAADARREALLFLVHFVGDMHQPLHCSDNHDKGGNDVHVIFFDRESNLHSVWDSGLIGRMPTEDEIFPGLSHDSQNHAHKWAKGSVEDWAEQIHKAAVKVVYGKLPKMPQPLQLGTTYERTADPLIRTQLSKAGARLARVLNETLQ
jgi:nuclease S1